MSVEARIRQKLSESLTPEVLEVTNESGQHNVPPGSESHFRVLVVSDRFDGQNRLARHRSVHKALATELAAGLHALAIDAWTSAEWQERGTPSTSPRCHGGS